MGKKKLKSGIIYFYLQNVKIIGDNLLNKDKNATNPAKPMINVQ